LAVLYIITTTITLFCDTQPLFSEDTFLYFLTLTLNYARLVRLLVEPIPVVWGLVRRDKFLIDGNQLVLFILGNLLIEI